MSMLALLITACGPENDDPAGSQNPTIPAPAFAEPSRDVVIFKEFNNPVTAVLAISDQEEPLTYSLSGEHAQYFSINTTTGGLYLDIADQNETRPSHYQLIVSAADRFGQTAEKQIDIEIISNYGLTVLSPLPGSNIAIGESASAPFTVQLDYVDIIGKDLGQISVTVDGMPLVPTDDSGQFWHALIDVPPGQHVAEIELTAGDLDAVSQTIDIHNRPAITGSYSNFTYNDQTNQIIIPDDQALKFYGMDLDNGNIEILNSVPDPIEGTQFDFSYIRNLSYVPWTGEYYTTIGGSLFLFDNNLEAYSKVEIENSSNVFTAPFDIFIDDMIGRIYITTTGIPETSIYEIDSSTQEINQKYTFEIDRVDPNSIVLLSFTLDKESNRAFFSGASEPTIYGADLISGESQVLLDLSAIDVHFISKPIFHQDSQKLYVIAHKGGLSSLLEIDPETQKYSVVSGYDMESSPYINTAYVGEGPIMKKAASPFLHPYDGSLLVRSKADILQIDLETGNRTPLYSESLFDNNVTPGNSLLIEADNLYVKGGTNRFMQRINAGDLSDKRYLDWEHSLINDSWIDPLRSRSIPAYSKALTLKDNNKLVVFDGRTERSHLVLMDAAHPPLPFDYQTDFTYFEDYIVITDTERTGLVHFAVNSVPFTRTVSVKLEEEETIVSLSASKDAIYMLTASQNSHQYRLIQTDLEGNQIILHEVGFEELQTSRAYLRISYLPETDSVYFLGDRDRILAYDLSSEELTAKPISQGVRAGAIHDIAMDPSEQFYWLLSEGGHLFHFKDGTTVMVAN